MAKAGHGLMLGKFLPPHAGHQFLVQFAQNFVEKLTVMVCTLKREPIPGELRSAWMRELFPQARIVPITDDLPQEPSEHPKFWDIWREVVLRATDEPLDFVFASEEYGERLAAEVGAKFIPVDGSRSLVPISGTAVRNDRWPIGSLSLCACVPTLSNGSVSSDRNRPANRLWPAISRPSSRQPT